MNYMLDSDVCIYLMQEDNLSLFSKLDEIDESNLFISTVVLSELQFGISNSYQKEANQSILNSFLKRLKIVSYNEKCAFYYGEIRVNLRRQGTPIGPNDLFIAAHAIAENSTLITNNTREFKRIDNLKVVSWQEL